MVVLKDDIHQQSSAYIELPEFVDDAAVSPAETEKLMRAAYDSDDSESDCDMTGSTNPPRDTSYFNTAFNESFVSVSSPEIVDECGLGASEPSISFNPECTEAVIGQASFTWKIEDWSAISNVFRHYSESFYVAVRPSINPNTGDIGEENGWWFRLLLMPRGQDRSDQSVSIYLCLDADKNGAKMVDEWSACVEFIIGVIDPVSGKHFSKYTSHRFDTDAIDWGFSHFLFKSMSQADSIHPFISHGHTIFNVRLRIIEDPTGMLWISPGSIAYDSKRATGCVGLQNQGATCYMNSILQSLFLTNCFRKSIFFIPTEGKSAQDSIPLALQRLFYALTFSTQPPSTQDLTASFGWHSHQSFTQHDVQEFLRVLMDDLEEKFKGTSGDGTIDRMFGGRVKKVIRCLNIPFESSRVETVYDVQMPVDGCGTLIDSFNKYTTRETMSGDNQYMAEGHGLQDAEMFNVFDRLPPVLHLNLMRYRYDPYRDTTVKINDRFEFPDKVNLDGYMSDTADKSSPQDYLLHSVLVHSGDGHGGHYVAFIRPDPVHKPSFWLKFDDTKVTAVSREEAIDANFGGNNQVSSTTIDNDHDASNEDFTNAVTRGTLTPKFTSREAKLAYYKRVTNAYMLVYIRAVEADRVLCNFSLSDVPPHVIRQIEEEVRMEEAKYQELLLQRSTVRLTVYTPNTIKRHPGYDLFCSEPHPTCPITPSHQFRLKRDLSLSAIVDALQATEPEFKHGGRVWNCAVRRNKTLRSEKVLYDSALYHSGSIIESPLGSLVDKTSDGLIQLFAEPIIPEVDTGLPSDLKSSIYIYFKLFDPFKNTLTPLRGLLVDKEASVGGYEPFLVKMLQYCHLACPQTSSPAEGLLFDYYEEVKVGRVDPIRLPERSFTDCELRSGDIVVIVPRTSGPPPPYSPLDYYSDLQSMLQVNFINVQQKEGKRFEDFDAVISAKAEISDLLKLISEKTGWDQDKIRPFPIADTSPISSPRPATKHELDWDGADSRYWTEYLLGNQTFPPSMSVPVFYEVLPISLAELSTKGFIRLKDRDGAETAMWLDKTAPLSSIDLSGTELLKNCERGTIHAYELAGRKIYKEYPMDTTSIRDIMGGEVFLERFPEVSDPDKEIYCPVYLHYRDVPQGHPFMFKLIVGEPMRETRRRLAARLGITVERDIHKLNIAMSRYGRVQKQHPARDDDAEGFVLWPEMRGLSAHEQIAVEHQERPKTPSEHSIRIKRTAPATE